MEKYSSGRRGAPAKGVGRATGARVQIPPSPPFGTAFAHAVLLFLSKRYFCYYNTEFKKYKQEINNKKLPIKCSQLFYFVIKIAFNL